MMVSAESPHRPGWRCSLMLLVLLACSLCAVAADSKAPSPVGVWDGTMQGKAGEVNFAVEILSKGNKLEATLLNANDRQPFSSATWDGSTLSLRLDYYDGQVTAHFVSPQRIEGEYSRLTSKGMVRIPLTLVPQQHFSPGAAWKGPELSGDWLLDFPQEEGTEKTPFATFDQQKLARSDGKVKVTGVIEPVSGDTGLLHGTLTSDPNGQTHFHLSRFDGIHAIAIDGSVQPDGSLLGQYGGIVALDPFSGHRVTDKASVDPNVQAGSLTKVKDTEEPFRFRGLDAAGKVVDQSSPQFQHNAVIVDIFGTWCPNCHDEAPVLEELYRKYHAQGLEIVGLSYEYSDDTARSLRQIEVYRAKYGITFSLLLTGTTAQGQIEKTLPQLVHFGAFPTTIFLDRQGLVHAIHAGFTGPSTGDKYREVQHHMDELARQILGTSK
jgi:thiol-disulfide isomerase/thioredoxin